MTDMQPPPADQPAAPPPPAPAPAAQWAPPPSAAAARPTGATVITVISSVLGAFYALFGVIALLGAGILGAAGGAVSDQSGVPGLGGFLAGLGLVLAIIFLGIAALYIASAYGTWKARGWAWMLTLVVSIIFGIFAVLGLLGNVNLISILLLAAPVATIYYLWQPDVKRYLGRPA